MDRVSDMNTPREALTGSGPSNTQAIGVGGEVPPLTGATETWDGTSWTEENDLSTVRKKCRFCRN